MSDHLPSWALRKLMASAKDGEEVDESVDLDPKYEILEEVGRGGMGIVYKARDRELGRIVALKRLESHGRVSDEAWRRFEREAKTVARLSHPNIAPVYEASRGVISMLFVEGPTLAELPAGEDRLRVRLIRDAALAVHHAHVHGIVHRDLKPQNLMVDEAHDHVYVMDFGLAKQVEVDSSLSLTGAVLGTPTYMPPEQVKGTHQFIDGRTDIYSLGATLFELLTGHRLFISEDVYEVLRRVVEEEAPSLRSVRTDLDRDLETIVAKCLEKSPSRRYATARALAEDLDRWLEGKPIEARRPSNLYRLKKAIARRPLPFGILGLSLVAIGILLAFLLPMLDRRQEELIGERKERETVESELELWSQISNHLNDAERYRQHGEIRLSDERLDLAIEKCEQHRRDHESAYACYFLGRLLRLKGEVDSARQALDRALALDPDLGEARHERGLLLVQEYGMRNSIMRLLLALDVEAPRVTALTPDKYEYVYMPLAMVRDVAIKDLSAEVGQSSYFKEVDRLFGEAELQRFQGHDDKAERTLTRILDSEPLDYRARLSLGILALGREDWDGALEHLDRALDVHRGLARAYVARSLAYRWKALQEKDQSQQDSLLASYRQDVAKALQFAPDLADVQVSAGNVAFDNGDTKEALAYYDSALELEELHAIALLNRSIVHSVQGDLEDSVTDARAATRILHASPAPWTRLGDALLQQAKAFREEGNDGTATAAEALEAIERALRKAKDAMKPYPAEAHRLHNEIKAFLKDSREG